MDQKKCSGCKTTKTLDNFYKNKLVLDGHSNYCIECTRENSRRYFQRKKEKQSKIESDNLMKTILLNSVNTNPESANVDGLMKILMIEKMLKSVNEELDHLKKTYVKSENVLSN